MSRILTISVSIILLLLFSCSSQSSNEINNEKSDNDSLLIIEAENYISSKTEESSKGNTILLKNNQWLAYELDVKIAGRYKVTAHAKANENSTIWIEDYIDNKDDRTYDITGKIKMSKSSVINSYSKFGSPLNVGKHKIKVHLSEGSASLDKFTFELIQKHIDTPISHQQNMNGNDWELVWEDNFNGSGLPDSTKWSYNIGNWGWGNNELQYYTKSRTENARLEGGKLIIEARKDDWDQEWTSARLTTQGRHTFLYGKIEFRAKVPEGRGTWAAGWLLGDEYKDELSWPYCGEIDVLECVGFEIDDSGNGKNHATCHTRAYYFKQGNQIGSEIEMENMNTEFHTYAIEWYPDVIYGFVDGIKYYTYDKNKDELEWPFHKAQNIIINLAIGGGWGGAKGIDESLNNQQYILDYVRVYELK